jgi:glycosidase
MGYDIADYRSIHPPYGTIEDVDKLITGLRERGMKLVMDLVVNHTSDQVSNQTERLSFCASFNTNLTFNSSWQHNWFKESRASIDSPKRDWYIWRKPRIDSAGKRCPPNNWASIFGGRS